jgi:peptidoglycan hydrolase-like protein with peptidoglycan-binding domain
MPMTPRRVKLGLAAFVALSGAAAVNLALMQPGGGRGGATARPARGLDRLPGIESTTLQSPTPAKSAAAGAAARRDGAVARAAPPPRDDTDDAETTRAVQRELALRGYYQGAIDGIAGLVTQGAIMAFEYDHGRALSATASEDLLKAIMLADARRPSQPVAAWSPAVGARAEQVIRTVQQSLIGLGHKIGVVDGLLGAETVRAIRTFEVAQHLGETGRVSGALVARLATLASQGRLAAGRN